jgi:N6-L-threonylcarbamoyladenine synthase
VVEDGKRILSNVIASQIDAHRPFYGVVPEIASRKHVESISFVVRESLREAGLALTSIEAIAATYRPGLIGSLLVGLSFAKGLALARRLPFIGVDHIQAHLYAPHLERDIAFPYLGLIVSGGHTIIARSENVNRFHILGTTIDDACGEAFDKVAKHFDLGFPGGLSIDRLARKGNPAAFRFPKPSLHKGDHRYDVSYSGLKTAAVHQLDQFWSRKHEKTPENIAAAFEKAAIDIVAERVVRAARDTKIHRIVAGGGVSANTYLRERLHAEEGLECIFPSLSLCTDNGAMIAGLAYHLWKAGETSGWDLNAQARVPGFRKTYP